MKNYTKAIMLAISLAVPSASFAEFAMPTGNGKTDFENAVRSEYGAAAEKLKATVNNAVKNGKAAGQVVQTLAGQSRVLKGKPFGPVIILPKGYEPGKPLRK